MRVLLDANISWRLVDKLKPFEDIEKLHLSTEIGLLEII